MKRFIPFVKAPPRVAVLRLQGAIGVGRMPLNDEALAPLIERAFSRGKPKAVALLINSPGGSPVQSARIASRIRRLSEEKDIPVHAFVEDVAASGGYWLACAARDIWADPASVVGSIGVISGTFGAHEFIARHGIERRVYTAGKSKSQLDPFRPENPEDIARLKVILDDMHQIFIDHVKASRGDRLADDPRLFTGEFWLAGKALDLGLIDGTAHLEPKLKELYGDKVKLIPYGRKRGLLQRFGATLAGDAMAEIEERAQFSRYGL
ncbi:S49 family peptidase [Aquicoccus porphyridii]|uniref:S49 family peptidase n=1 Tax=Aquicoccus porphyridii TaxID=1852029 RepID=A0A5A9Z533_9RHOB|nr:S49 family peptidase [Aquicoccus porphyridii]KAA0912232.1 S49 family peptidase [Aquicoccus porphyridii]RAI52919.1 S49 family peptidase [Rhodobacteraceae bacterium AsT-22]